LSSANSKGAECRGFSPHVVNAFPVASPCSLGNGIERPIARKTLEIKSTPASTSCVEITRQLLSGSQLLLLYEAYRRCLGQIRDERCKGCFFDIPHDPLNLNQKGQGVSFNVYDTKGPFLRQSAPQHLQDTLGPLIPIHPAIQHAHA
jgi:hypothetical protein